MAGHWLQLELWMVQLCSRFDRFTKLMNFDIAVTGLNYVHERLIKTNQFFEQSSVSKSLAGQRHQEHRHQDAPATLPPPYTSLTHRHMHKCKQALLTLEPGI